MDFAQRFPQTPVVVATRTLSGVEDVFAPTFASLRIEPLTPAQQRQVILQWLYTAHSDKPLIAVQTTQRILDLLSARGRVAAWASTPLMLVLLTALIDTDGASGEANALSRAVLLRRALRLLLGQWGILAIKTKDDPIGKRRLGGEHLWAKEQLLLQLASSTFERGRQEVFTEDDVLSAWQSLPPLASAMATDVTVLSELSGEDGFLPQLAERQYAFYHPIFQEYLTAAAIADSDLSTEARLSTVARTRLDDSWDETTQLLVDELDRLDRSNEADQVVGMLIDSDRAPLPGLSWSDPTHLALRRAARAQGNRTAEHQRNDIGVALAAEWQGILQFRLASRVDYGLQWTWSPDLINACQAFLDMNEAAATAAPLFRDIARDVVRQASGRDLHDFTPDPLVRLIEALGASEASKDEASDDIALLARLLELDQGIGEPQAAALRGLLRLGPKSAIHIEICCRGLCMRSARLGPSNYTRRANMPPPFSFILIRHARNWRPSPASAAGGGRKHCGSPLSSPIRMPLRYFVRPSLTDWVIFVGITTSTVAWTIATTR